MAEGPGIDPMLLQLSLLAGIGLTQLPKLQQGMAGKQAKASAAGGLPQNLQALLPLLQGLAQQKAGGEAAPGGPTPPAQESEPPAVPRFPVAPPVRASISPNIPRVAPMDAS